MAKVIVTMEVMPDSPDINLEEIKAKAKQKIEEKQGLVKTVEEKPVAFGLKAVVIVFVVDEKQGSPDPIAEWLETQEGITSAQITMVSRALG